MGITVPPQLRSLLEVHSLEHDPALTRGLAQALESADGGQKNRIDASALSAAELQALVRSASVIQANEEVSVWWPADGISVRMSTDLLVGFLDDWWYPAQDDLVVTDGSRYLVIDHEEIATWW